MNYYIQLLLCFLLSSYVAAENLITISNNSSHTIELYKNRFFNCTGAIGIVFHQEDELLATIEPQDSITLSITCDAFKQRKHHADQFYIKWNLTECNPDEFMFSFYHDNQHAILTFDSEELLLKKERIISRDKNPENLTPNV